MLISCVFPEARTDSQGLRRSRAETSAEGPGKRVLVGVGGSSTWGPWCEASQLSHGALPGDREADWMGKGPLCKVLGYLQSLSPHPPRQLQVLLKQEGADLHPPPPPQKTRPPPCASHHSMSPCLQAGPRRGGGGLENEHLCQVGGRVPGEGGHGSSYPTSSSPRQALQTAMFTKCRGASEP